MASSPRPSFTLLFWHKLVLTSGICMILLAGGLILTNHWFMLRAGAHISGEGQAMLEKTNKQFLTSIVTGQADTIDHQLEQAKNTVNIGSLIVETSLQEGRLPEEKIFRLLLNNSGPFSTTIYYLPKDGPATVYNQSEGQQNKTTLLTQANIGNLSDFAHNSAHGHTVTWSAIHTNPYIEAYDRIINAVTPIHIHNQKVGEFGISVSVISLTAQFNHRQAIRGSYNFLLDNEKHLVASPPLALVDLKPSNLTTISRGMLDLSQIKAPSFKRVLHTMALGNEAVEKVSFPSGSKIMAYRPLRNANWRLGLVVPEKLASITTQELKSVIAQRSRTALMQMTLISLTLLGLTLILVAITSRKMSRPLKKITAAANQISRGKLNHLIPVTSHDEIGTLAISFNAMSRQLKEFIDHIHESENRYRVLFERSPVSLLEEDFSQVKTAIEQLHKKGISNLDDYFTQHKEEAYALLGLIQVKDVNEATLKLFGASTKDQLIGNFSQLTRNTSFESLKEELLAIDNNRMFEIESENQTLDGRTLTLIQRSSIPPGFEKNWKKVLISLFDLTERKRFEEEKSQLENQLLQAYKMEAIGTLAGGIAHDFNNILAAILGYTELLKTELPSGSKADGFVDKVMQAGNRARDLVSQILTFSRRSSQAKQAVSLKTIIVESTQLLRASIPASIHIKQNLHSDGVVMADSSQLHQVMINLCTNASLAMQSTGGTMAILLEEKSGYEIPEAANDGKAETTFVRLAVSDTGCGIEPDIINRIFEPFFTTRDRYKGTGMGLAVVHGIIKSFGGYLHVNSILGKGAEIGFSLPKADLAPEMPESTPKPFAKGYGENILYVDDETALTDMVELMLKARQYNVITFNSPTKALEHFKARPNDYQLIITDLTMPEMTGDNLAKAILKIRPDIPVLLCTGYNDLRNSNNKRFRTRSGVTAIFNKPFTADDLLKHVKIALSSSKTK